jgi:uncharacterized protein YodC (DUF2158 family)
MDDATLKAGDHVKHNEIGTKMVVIGLGDINGRDLAWCKWTDRNGDTQQTTFPTTELSIVS